MANKSVLSAKQDDVSLSRQVQGLREDSNISQASAEVLVISDDDDEIKIVELKRESTVVQVGEVVAESAHHEPTRYTEVFTEDEKVAKENSESPRDQTCSVCLGKFDNKAFLDQCFHAFCFYCILQWSEVVQTCPLCKSSFSSIIHTVKAMEDFQQHFLPAPAMTSNGEGTRRFHYRTTLTGDQVYRRQQRQTAWQLKAQRRQAYQSAQRNKQTVAREKRRMVYSGCLWVQRVNQQGKPKYRDVSSGFFRANPACTHRLVPWLKRELGVLLNDSESHVHFIQHLVMTLINKVEISSDEFLCQLRPFLAERTDHFSHEFYSFARSPFDMTAYDERVQYGWPESIDIGRPGTETPTVFHGSSTGWETPAIPEGPTHSRWDRNSPPQQQNANLWSSDSSRKTTSTNSPGQCGDRILQSVRLSVNFDTAEVASDRHRADKCRRGSDGDERRGTKTLSHGRSHRRVDSSRSQSRSTSRSRSHSRVRSRTRSRSQSRTRSGSRAQSHARSRGSSPGKTLSKPRHKGKHKHKLQHKHKHKHRHAHRKKDERHLDKAKCEHNAVGKSDPSNVRCPAATGDYRRGTVNVIVVSSDGATSPDLECMQQTTPTTYKSTSAEHSRSRTLRHKKSRSRSNSRISRSPLSSNSRKSRHKKSRSGSNSRTVSRSPLSSNSRKSRHKKSRSPLSSNSRKSRHKKSRSRSNSRTVSRSPLSSNSRKSRHEKSRTRSRSNSKNISRSPQRRNTSSDGKSGKRSRHDKSRTRPCSNSGAAPSRLSDTSPSRSPSQSEGGVSSLCPMLTGSLASVRESQSSSVRAQSPSVEEMEREIRELEVRMAEDKKRLLQLLLKQEERKMKESEENRPGPS